MKSFVYSAAVLAIATSAAYGQSQPVQWRVEDGGNGHWYQLKIVTAGITWHEAQSLSISSRGHLATCESQVEREFINQTFSPENTAAGWFQQGGGSGTCPLFGPWIGGFQDTAAAAYSEPYGGWRWVTGAPFNPQDSFCCNNSCFGSSEEYLHLYRGCSSSAVSWNDLRDDALGCGGNPKGYVIEWSADCNNDSIVDYGQILNGQLPDANSNGVPDTCEAPLCPADLSGNGVVNGVDLAAVLSSWGTNGQSELNADINRDGIVNGQDLAFVLGSWGPCSTVPAWATVIEFLPDPAVVFDPTLRAAITATRLPWRVRDTATQIEFVLIPPGTFHMGCSASTQHGCDADELPVHAVSLSQPFYLGRYEVTQAQWTATMGSNPSAFQSASPQVPENQVATRPVERVSWNMIQGFLSATGMRLPTEAEWEYAYRAGTTTAFHSMPGYPNGTSEDSLVGSIAWVGGISGNQTWPVGERAGNGFGLHDMSGNVWEWVNDWYGPYATAAESNPTGPDSGFFRVLRGGSWGNVTYFVRSSVRIYGNPDDSDDDVVGFRVARNL